MKSSLFNSKDCQIKNTTVTDYIYNILTIILLLIVSFDYQLTFYFHDAKQCMRVAVKDQWIIEPAVPYCSKLTAR